MLETLVKFYMAAAGSAALIKVTVRGTPFAVKPFTCTLCMGFWSGMTLAIFMPQMNILNCIQMSLGASLFSWAAWRLVMGES